MNASLDKIEDTWRHNDEELVSSNMVRCLDKTIVIGSIYHRIEENKSFYEVEVLNGGNNSTKCSDNRISIIWRYESFSEALTSGTELMTASKFLVDHWNGLMKGNYSPSWVTVEGKAVCFMGFIWMIAEDDGNYSLGYNIPTGSSLVEEFPILSKSFVLAKGRDESMESAKMACLSALKAFLKRYGCVAIDYTKGIGGFKPCTSQIG